MSVCYLDEEAETEDCATSPTSVEEAWCSWLVALVNGCWRIAWQWPHLRWLKVGGVERTIFHAFTGLILSVFNYILVCRTYGNHERFKLEILSMDKSSQLSLWRIKFNKFLLQASFLLIFNFFRNDRRKLAVLAQHVFFKKKLLRLTRSLWSISDH